VSFDIHPQLFSPSHRPETLASQVQPRDPSKLFCHAANRTSAKPTSSFCKIPMPIRTLNQYALTSKQNSTTSLAFKTVHFRRSQHPHPQSSVTSCHAVPSSCTPIHQDFNLVLGLSPILASQIRCQNRKPIVSFTQVDTDSSGPLLRQGQRYRL
jgi:hypothetical protein